MKTLIELVKEQESKLMRLLYDQGIDVLGSAALIEAFDTAIITLLEANCERLRADRDTVDCRPYTTEWYIQRTQNAFIEEELEYYTELIRSLK